MGRHHFFNQLKDMEGCKGTIRLGIAKGEKVYTNVKICSVLLVDQIGYSMFIEHPDGSKELITGKRPNIKFNPAQNNPEMLAGSENIKLLAGDSNG
jgi:hypothetical protein